MLPFVLDMVHHNPGEAPFQTAFSDPAHLQNYGYTGQVWKHLNAIATFAALGEDFFPSPEAKRWLDAFTKEREAEMQGARNAGLQSFYHIDLFVLPRLLVEKYADQLCDQNGRISVDKDFTLEVHRTLFEELFARFPDLEGLAVRHGETYLYDTPFHVGNGPVAWHPPFAEPEKEVERFVRLIQFLREEICVRHGKTLIFRTWDYLDHKFHADPAYYRAVVDQIEPHPKLIFSIKHTRLDFMRRVMVNEAHGQGAHPQIVEVQCQREYEGKGAFPNYIAHGVIEGFEENARPIGLKQLLQDERARGLYTWSRGGGWYGPLIKNELWPDLNAFVVAGFAAGRGSEEELFGRYAREILGLNEADIPKFRELCLLSARGVLKGRSCEFYDASLGEKHNSANLWMRDDRLGGEKELAPIFEFLRENGGVQAALQEKREAVQIWRRIETLAQQIAFPDQAIGHFVRLSSAYGARLFEIVERGWTALLQNDLGAARDYWAAWDAYKALENEPGCPSLYEGAYFSMPGNPPAPGLDDAVRKVGS